MIDPVVQAPALVLVAGLLFLHIWRRLFLKWEESAHTKKHRQRQKLLITLHYYTPMYGIFAYLLFTAAKNAWTQLSATKFLQPDLVKAMFAGEKYADLESEISLDDCQWLRWLSLSSPFFTLLTVLVCIHHTMRHVKEVKRRNVGICHRVLHDRAIQIVALPTIYGLMSFNAVTRMWQTIVNSQDLNNVVKGGFNERKELLADLYDVNFMVADLYEAWALFQFAELALKVIETQFHKEEKMLETIVSGAGKNSAEMQRDTNLVLQSNKELIQSVDKLTVQGIYSFIATCLIQSVFSLCLTTGQMTKMIPAKYLANLPSIKASSHMFFLGMGTISSSAAIGNILTVEQTHHEKLHHFKPTLKFWGTKILVSLAFLQSLLLYVIPGVNVMSATKQNLLYSSALCIECFLVSLLHLISWQPEEEWYHEVEDEERGYIEGQEELGEALLKHKQQEFAKDDHVLYNNRPAVVSDVVRGKDGIEVAEVKITFTDNSSQGGLQMTDLKKGYPLQ